MHYVSSRETEPTKGQEGDHRLNMIFDTLDEVISPTRRAQTWAMAEAYEPAERMRAHGGKYWEAQRGDDEALIRLYSVTQPENIARLVSLQMASHAQLVKISRGVWALVGLVALGLWMWHH